jgi:NADPH-dependent 2,4-dienoyl-CoA reductase/sulfur reductase-like enzyme
VLSEVIGIKQYSEKYIRENIMAIVIVGAGTAGVNAAFWLRQYGYKGGIRLLSWESVVPYQRPPLSKSFLTSETAESAIPLKPESFYTNNNISISLNTQIVSIDVGRKVVAAKDGEEYAYEKLILATGASARRLTCEGSELSGVCYLRSMEDAKNLRRKLVESASVVVLGGGVIGLEVASAAVGIGRRVTVIEAAPRVMARVVTPAAANLVRARLEAEGVGFKLNAKLTSIKGRNGHVDQCVLESGEEIQADLIIVGIGAIPELELATEAALEVSNGVVVDDQMRTSDTSIYAIGDCALARNLFFGTMVRLETIHNAVTQAQIVASSICGTSTPAPTPPRFWSDLKGMTLQGLGALKDYDKLVVAINNETVELEVLAYKQERLIATETINRPKRQGALGGSIKLPD